MQYSQKHLKTMVYAEFGEQTECIMGNSKIENGFSLCFLVVLLNLKPACLHTSIRFCVNRSVIVSTLMLFSAVFSLFFVSILSKSRPNSYFALSSQTNFLNSPNVISSDRFPEHLFSCFSINAYEREQWSDRWGSRSLTIK